MKGGALPELRFNPEPAVVLGHDFHARGQANAGAFILVRGMQASEGIKNDLVVLRRDANAVVRHGEVPEVVFELGVHRDEGGVFPAEFESVAYEILKQLHESCRITQDHWHRADIYARPVLYNDGAEVLHDGVEYI